MIIRCKKCKKNVETKEDALSVFDSNYCVGCLRLLDQRDHIAFTPMQIAVVEEKLSGQNRGIHPIIHWMAVNSGCDKCSRCGTWDYVSELAHTLCDDCRDDQI